jgi:hypothetical protein
MKEDPMATTSRPSPFGATLRRLYFIRFAFAIVWAVLLLPTGDDKGAGLTVLLVVYPLVDAAAVLWQLRSAGDTSGPRLTERLNVAVSVIVAIALGWASTYSIAAALGVWGGWAAASGLTQLITAVRHRGSGGQVPQILSGGISVVAGIAFLAQSFNSPDSMSGVAGYAILGGVFFLVSALRLGRLLRPAAS